MSEAPLTLKANLEMAATSSNRSSSVQLLSPPILKTPMEAPSALQAPLAPVTVINNISNWR